jgi:hypothetical protein
VPRRCRLRNAYYGDALSPEQLTYTRTGEGACTEHEDAGKEVTPIELGWSENQSHVKSDPNAEGGKT